MIKEEVFLDGKEVIEIKDVSKAYGDVKALDKVSLSVKKNSIFGLFGSNGAGKSTLLHILVGLLGYDSGEIKIFGRDIKHFSKALKRRVSLVPQKISLYNNLTTFDNLYFFGKAMGLKREEIKKRIQELSEILQLGDLKRKIRHLSGGYQRRVSLAVSLLGNPDLLILDEALVGIDLETKNIIANLLLKLKKNKTIIITTHSVREAEMLCEYMCFLHRGKNIMQGRTSDILKKYSSKHEVKIKIRFKEKTIAEDIQKRIKDTKIKSKIEKDVLTLSFLGCDYQTLDVLNYIQGDGKKNILIEDVEIEKPGLESIMMKLMRENK